jgi:hypothetical protein
LSQAFTGFPKSLMLKQLANEIFLRELALTQTMTLRINLSLLREKGLTFPMKQSGRHDQELTGGIEVELLHQANVSQVLIGNLTDRDPRDIHLMGLN